MDVDAHQRISTNPPRELPIGSSSTLWQSRQFSRGRDSLLFRNGHCVIQDQPAAIHVDGLPNDIGGILAREEGYHFGDLFRVAEAPDGCARQYCAAQVRSAADRALRHVSLDRA